MNDATRRGLIAGALAGLDQGTFEKLAIELLRGEFVIERHGSETNGERDGGLDFIARNRQDLSWIAKGQVHHPKVPGRSRAKGKLGPDLKKLAKVGPATRSVIFVTSAPLTSQQKVKLIDAAPGWDLLIRDGRWTVDTLLQPRFSHLLTDVVGLRWDPSVFSPAAYLRALHHPAGTAAAWQGRDGERAELLRLLEAHALVLVRGEGGIGKSRLVAESGLADEARLEHRRPWHFLGASAAPDGDWRREAGGQHCVLVLDDPLTREGLVRQVLDLLRQPAGQQLKAVLTLRPEEGAAVESRIPWDVSVGRLDVGRLRPTDIDALIRADPFGVEDESHRSEIVRQADGNPAIAQLLATSTPGRAPLEGLWALVQRRVEDDRLRRLLGVIASFEELPTFDSCHDLAPPRDPGSVLEQRRRRVESALRDASGLADEIELTEALDDLVATGLVSRRRSLHGASLKVRPDILAEAVASGVWFGDAAAASRFRERVLPLARDICFEHALTPRLVRVASGSKGAAAVVQGLAARAAEGVGAAPPDRQATTLRELMQYAPVAPDECLAAAGGVIDALEKEVPGPSSPRATGADALEAASGLLALCLSDEREAVADEAFRILLRAAAVGTIAGAVGDCPAAERLLVEAVTPGVRARNHDGIRRRLAWAFKWWQGQPLGRLDVLGRMLAASVATAFVDGVPVPARRDAIRLRQVILDDEACAEHVRGLGGLLRDIAASSPRGAATALDVIAAAWSAAARSAAGPGLRAAIAGVTGDVSGVFLEVSPRVGPHVRATLFELAAWIRTSQLLPPALEAEWERLRDDPDVRLVRHLRREWRRWDDMGAPMESHWPEPEHDGVLQREAARAVAAPQEALIRWGELASDAGEVGAPALAFEWLGAHVAQLDIQAALGMVTQVIIRGDDQLRRLAHGALRQSWWRDEARTSDLVSRLRIEHPRMTAEVVVGALQGQLTESEWSLLAGMADALGEQLATRVVAAMADPPPGVSAAGVLLPLALRHESVAAAVLDRLAPPGDPDGRREEVPIDREADYVAVTSSALLAPSRLDSPWVERSVRWLAREHSDAFVNCLLERLSWRGDVLERGVPVLPAALVRCVADLPMDAAARDRLRAQMLAWLRDGDVLQRARSARVLREALSADEIVRLCDAALSELSAASEDVLRTLGPLLPWPRCKALVKSLLAKGPEHAALADRIIAEHAEPSGSVRFRSRLPSLRDRERMVDDVAEDADALVRLAARRLKSWAELRTLEQEEWEAEH